MCCCARRFPQAKDALQLGLVDQMVKPDELMMAAGKLALMIAAGKVPRRVTSKLNDKIGSYEMAKAVIETGRAGALKKNRNLPQPFAYLDAVEAGVRDGFEAGLDKEITLMAGLVMHPVAKSLMVRRNKTKPPAELGMQIGGLRDAGVICPSVLISHRRHCAVASVPAHPSCSTFSSRPARPPRACRTNSLASRFRLSPCWVEEPWERESASSICSRFARSQIQLNPRPRALLHTPTN